MNQHRLHCSRPQSAVVSRNHGRPNASNLPTVPVHTYNSGQPYRSAAGRNAYHEAVQLHRFTGHPIVRGFPTAAEFLIAVKRELKIRAYRRNTRTAYISNLNNFLRWFEGPPHQVTSEDIRNFLELLVDGGASPSTLSGFLSALRTAFDKFCGRDVTLGLATPRRRKTQPVVLSPAEVQRVIAAAPKLSIKLAIGIMYAAGLRNGELCRLRVADLDFERRTIRVFQGKGQTDRTVLLPKTFDSILRQLCDQRPGSAFLFPSTDRRRKQTSDQESNRHISSRTLQRWVSLSVDLAGLKKRVTPHSFRHAFATHLLENGTDIRYIQKLLGHARLETTTIYTRVAKIRSERVTSPLDQLPGNKQSSAAPATVQKSASSPPVGRMSFELTRVPDQRAATVSICIRGNRDALLTGIEAFQNDQNWIEIRLPPLDQWQATITTLPRLQQDRIQSPEFFELIRQQISQRLLGLLRPG